MTEQSLLSPLRLTDGPFQCLQTWPFEEGFLNPSAPLWRDRDPANEWWNATTETHSMHTKFSVTTTAVIWLIGEGSTWKEAISIKHSNPNVNAWESARIRPKFDLMSDHLVDD